MTLTTLTRAQCVPKETFPGEVCGPDARFYVEQPFEDGSAHLHTYNDEDLAMQCAVRIGGQVQEFYEL